MTTASSLQNPNYVPPQPQVTVSVQDTTNDVLDNSFRKDSEHLNKLAEVVRDAPTANQFNDYAFPNPTNSDLKTYVLPDYLRLFVTHLLIRMNATPSDLPPLLRPYIQHDPTLNVLVTHEPSLDLLTLQRLDYLLVKDKEPSFLNKMVSKVTRRSKSKD